MNIYYCLYKGKKIAQYKRENRNRVNIKDLVKKIKDKSIISAQAIETMLFPITHDSIFISHFHSEKKLAEQVKEKIKSNLGLNCFIDSDIWGDGYKLLREMQISLCKKRVLHTKSGKDIKTYSLRACDGIAKEVFLLLSMALQKVVLNSSGFMFVTNQNLKNDIDNKLLVNSPWVAQELFASCIPPVCYKILNENASHRQSIQKPIKFSHSVSIEHLKKVKLVDLIYVLSH